MRSLFKLFGAPPKGDPAPPPAGDDAQDATSDEMSDLGVFVDGERDRSVPWRLYKPAPHHPRPAPVVIFSHGLGGSRDGAPYLGRALAEGGYFGLFIQHQGSDIRLIEDAKGPEAVKKALLDSLLDPTNMINRFTDAPFVLDELERLNDRPGPLQGQFDLDRIGMAGHSYGARTVLAAAGQAVGPMSAVFKDARIRAGVALSPSGGRGMDDEELVRPDHYGLIDIPMMHITGTEDRLPLNEDDDFDPYVRTLPFQHIPCDDQYLVVLDGAEHDDFSATRKGRLNKDTRYTVITAEAALLFFDAHLKENETAYFNLRNKLAEFLDTDDYFEFR